MNSEVDSGSCDGDNEMTMFKKQDMSYASRRTRRNRNKRARDQEPMSAGEMDEQEETSLIKNEKIHSENLFIDKQADLLYDKMKFYLDADFNLFVHGVGTKKDFLNSFVLS